MTQTSASRAEHFRRFSEELDALATRSDAEPPVSPEQIEAIFAEHEAGCRALEATDVEMETERNRAGRRA